MGAERTTVVTIDGGWGEHDGARMPGADIARALTRDGAVVSVDDIAVAGLTSVADAMLRYARESACDLIVMGGHGHVHAQEIVMGSTTRAILRSMICPVLMSH